MAIRVLKEVNRLPGYATLSTLTIVGGDVVSFETSDTTGGTIKPAANGTAIPLGLAIDSNVFFPIGGAVNQAGTGYDYTNYNRGGLIGVFTDGGVFELYDDGRGSPLLIGDAFTMNSPVYLSTTINGKISMSGTVTIGSVMAVAGSASTLKVTIKSIL